MRATISHDRSRIAFVTNEDGKSRVYLLDTKSREYRRVESIPTGLAFGVKFSPDDRRLGMTLNLALASAVHYSDKLTAAVDIVGISNFVTFLENTQDYRRELRRAEYGDERDPAMRSHLQKISPLNNVDKISVPLFVVQGENDPRVPVTEAKQMVEALREEGHTVWYMNALNEGHGYRKKDNRDTYQQAMILFFQEHLIGSD